METNRVYLTNHIIPPPSTTPILTIYCIQQINVVFLWIVMNKLVTKSTHILDRHQVTVNMFFSLCMNVGVFTQFALSLHPIHFIQSNYLNEIPSNIHRSPFLPSTLHPPHPFQLYLRPKKNAPLSVMRSSNFSIWTSFLIVSFSIRFDNIVLFGQNIRFLFHALSQ